MTHINDALAEVRLAIRSLWSTPGFTITALLALTIGIGANSAIFSVVNAVLLRPAPYPDPSRLVLLGYTFDGNPARLSSPTKFNVWRKYDRTFERTSAVRFDSVNRTDGPAPERLSSAQVSADFFVLLGAQFALGRPFTLEENRPRGARVVVISYREWEDRFGKAREALGKNVSLNGQPHEIVGVLAADFDTAIFSVSPRVWLPIQIDPASTEHPPSFRIIARLRPGVSLEHARQEAEVASNEFRQTFPQAMNPSDRLLVEPFQTVLVNAVRPSLLLLSGAVGLVLLIACVNVANLMLVRASIRQRDIAVRAALGASRGRIARELFTESLLVATGAGVLGLAVGLLVTRTLVTLYPGTIPRLGPDVIGTTVDWRVLTFTLALSLVTALVFGVIPSLMATRVNVVQALTEGATRSATSRFAAHVRSALVVVEMVVALVLLVGAGLLIRAFVDIQIADRGFDPSQLLIMRTLLAGERYATTANVTQVINDGLQRLQAIPDIAPAATCCAPFESDWRTSFQVVGDAPGGMSPPAVSYRIVSWNYFEALGIPVALGRGFSAHDDTSSPPVAVVNQAMAARFLANRDPFATQIVAFPGHRPDGQPERQIVGVVGNVRDGAALNQAWEPTIYVPLAQLSDRETAMMLRDTPLVWMVRTRTPRQALAGTVAETLRESTGAPAVVRAQPLGELLSVSAAPTTFSMTLLSLLGGSALLLAVTGVYGVTSYLMQQRMREIGVRLALGASPGRLQRMVLLQGLKLIATSLALGFAGAVALARMLQGTFFGVTTGEPFVFAVAPMVLAATATISIWLPARRASSEDLTIVMRT
jgi:putative ABC transport system permease protein